MNKTLFVFACLAFAVSSSAQTPDRSTAPRPGAAPSLRLPVIQKQLLGNGLRVLLVEHHEVPIVQVNLLFRSGSSADPAGKFGLASLTAAMLDEGAGTRSALELADALDYLGADLSTTSTFDFSAVRLHAPVAKLADALAIIADVVSGPTFQPQELDRLREERLTSLLQTRDDPASIAGAAFSRLVYGSSHRYGTLAVGTPATVRAFTVDDLRTFHVRHYQVSNATMIVVGDVTLQTLLPLIEKTLGAWKAGGAPPERVAVANAPQHGARQIYLVDKPDAAQSQIRIGWVGVPRSTPDYFTIVVLNTILGGSFASRLNQNLREQHGYAYGAGSTFDMRVSAGPFVASAGVQTDKTSEALVEFFNELKGIREPVPADELARTKNYVALRYPGTFETTGDIARRLEEMVVYQLPEDSFSNYVAAIQAVSAADVQRAAARYIQPDISAVVIVGDRQKIETGVKALGLAPVRIVPIDEVMEK